MYAIHAPSAESLGSMDPPGVEPPKSCLLASKPVVDDSTNATTAIYRTQHPDDSREITIQVSLLVDRPPLVSYVVVWSTDACVTEEPFIHSTHGGLILLSMEIDTEACPLREYYIYQPGCGHGGADAPSLKLVPQLRCLVRESCAVGLLSHGDGGGYYVALLTMQGKGEFELSLFCSEMGTWTVKKPALSLEDQEALLDEGDFMPNKVITVGGSVMAFVDLSKGILIGDVLKDSPEFFYLQLPPEEFDQLWTSYPLHTRDVSIDMSCGAIHIKFIELVCAFNLGAWAATTWSTTITATSPWSQLKEWDTHAILEARQLSVGDGISTGELLPEALHFEGKPNFGFLFVDMPMLSLHEDNMVCFLAKHHYLNEQVWVIAVDTVTKKLLGVHPLRMGRFTTLFYSTISSHLSIRAAASGAEGDLEWLGTHLQQEQGVMGDYDGDSKYLEHE